MLASTVIRHLFGFACSGGTKRKPGELESMMDPELWKPDMVGQE